MAKKYQRKQAKRYEMVKFTTDIFEGEFTFPSPKQMPLKVVEGMEKGSMSALTGWLEKAGVEEDAIEAFNELDGEEAGDFMKAWAEGEISVPKSSK